MSGGAGDQLGLRVNPSLKHRWEQYVAKAYGDYRGAKGDAIEDAMRRQIGADPILNQLHGIADALDVEKVKGKRAAVGDGLYAAPQGKNPGDVERRQQAVIDWILDAAEEGRLPGEPQYITRPILEERIEDIAGVHSPQTVDRYVKAISRRSMFRRSPEVPDGTWAVEP